MSTSPFLLIPLVASAQNNKYVTVNTAIDNLEAKLCSKISIAMTDADYTLSNANANQNIVFTFTGALTNDRNILLPARQGLYFIKNGTTGGHNLVVKVSGGTGITIAIADGWVMLYNDSVNVVALATSLGSTPFDIGVFAPGIGTGSQKLIRIKLARAVTFPAGATLSRGTASIGATGTGVYAATFTLSKNGTPFAYVVFDSAVSGGVVGTWTQAADAIFAAADLLEIDGPTVADATLADVGITLAGLR